jgi:protein SCO1/2
MKFTRALPWIAATALLGALAGGIAARMLTQKTPVLQAGTWLPQPLALPRFQMTDLNGQPYGNDALNGHPSLLFFGYTNCPDVCPATLAMLRDVQHQAPLAGLRIVFVSIDPERDVPAALREYLAAFSPDFIGLTGGQDALRPLLRSLSADAGRQSLPGGAYRLSHSATLYLLDTHGRLVAVYSPPLATGVLTADLRALGRSSFL